jgi:hypothetical protein
MARPGPEAIDQPVARGGIQYEIRLKHPPSLAGPGRRRKP